MIRIGVDLLGADREEEELLPGVLAALDAHEDLAATVYGHGERLKDALESREYDKDRLTIRDAGDVVTPYDDPMKARLQKPGSSLIMGLQACAVNETDGFVTSGASGAMFVSSLLILGRIGASRPALAVSLVGKNFTRPLLLDAGANTDCEPESLVEFARLGAAYMKAQGIENPRAALLSNGSEEGKGSRTSKAAFPLLRDSGLCFTGNIEGKDVFDDRADVIVCDGFAGNVFLKSVEGAAKFLLREMQAYYEEKDPAGLPHFGTCMKKCVLPRIDYNNEGGAVLLGVRKPVVKGHGAATARTVEVITGICYDLVKNKLTEKITAEFTE